MPLNNTTVCTRCLGEGKYSYNLKDGTVCYGCGGKGYVVVAPKGQKKIKPTVTHENKAAVGDILEMACVLYRVEEIVWIAYRVHKGKEVNQKMTLTRLVDEKITYMGRVICNETGTAIHPTSDLYGQNV